jgi:hypothetical protein
VASNSDARRRARPLELLSAGRFGVHFTADTELRDLIERARALASHRLPNGDLAALMKLVVASFVQQEEKRRFGIGAKARGAKTETMATDQGELMRDAERRTPPGGDSPARRVNDWETRESGPIHAGIHAGAHAGIHAGNRGRYLAVSVRREIYGRDGGQCAFVAADGRRCQARAFLEFDHRKPFARFGASDARNVRLLCKAHNLLHARNCFGAMHIAAKIAAKRR